MSVGLLFNTLFSQRLLLFNLSTVKALSISECWMVRGTAPLAASVRPILLSLAEGGLGTPYFRRSLRSSPHHLLQVFCDRAQRVLENKVT